MKTISDQAAIAGYIKKKALNEFKLARALRDLFDSTSFPLRGELQTVAKAAVTILVQLNNTLKDQAHYPKTSAAIAQVYADESGLKILQGVAFTGAGTSAILEATAQKLGALVTNVPNAQGIGEIVRLFAGICEKVDVSSDAKTELAQAVLAKNSAGVQLLATKPAGSSVSFLDFCSLRRAYRTKDFGASAFAPTARARSKKGDGADIDPDIAAVLGFPSPRKVAAGNTFFLPLLPGDVVRCMDEVLGLPEGASISGTTSDTIWALEALANFLFCDDSKNIHDVDANLLLLAVAAIVSGFHHTLLEVGLPMTINDYVTYQPGVYTSFQSDRMRTTAAGKLINDILREYEGKVENAFMYIASGPNGKTLFLAESPDEINRFKNAVKLDFAAYQRWKALAQSCNPYPRYFSADEIRNRVGQLI